MRFILTFLLLCQFWYMYLYCQVVVEHRPEKPFINVKKPEKPGDSYFWVAPHWKWGQDKNAYSWKNGFWEKKRKDFKYIPGHWRQVVGGWIWIPGKWIKKSEQERSVFVRYPKMRKVSFHLNEKPELEILPGTVSKIPDCTDVNTRKSVRPGDNYFWINGTWLWDENKNKYLWQHGQWIQTRPGFQYTHGKWIKIGNGWKWQNGYWLRKKD